MMAMPLKSLLLFVALLASAISLHLPEQAKNIAVVLADSGGDSRACVGFLVANQWAISSSYCYTDRWRGHTKIVAGASHLPEELFDVADARNVSGIFGPTSPTTPGDGHALKLFSFAPAYNQTNGLEISNATSWDDVESGNCSVSGFGHDGSLLSAVLPVENVSRCWSDAGAGACLPEVSGAVVECGGGVVAVATPTRGGRTLEFLGRYKKWMSDLNVKGSPSSRASDGDEDDCDVSLWIQAEDRCVSSVALGSAMFVLGASLFASM